MALMEFVSGQSEPASGDMFGRTGKLRELIVQPLGAGELAEQLRLGNIFLAAAQAGIAVTNLAAAATGFILSNPAGSGVVAIPLLLNFVQSSAAAAATSFLSLAANVNVVAATVVHTTPLAVRNAQLGSSRLSACLVDSSATLPAAPVIVKALAAPSVSATATVGIPPVWEWFFRASLGLRPGSAISLSSSAALSGVASMEWLELPEGYF